MTKIIPLNNSRKSIHLITDDICKLQYEFDILICSSYKNNYYPSSGTLIGSLDYYLGISVEELREDCVLSTDYCWLSKEIPNSPFKRIMCVEFLNQGESYSNNYEKEACAFALFEMRQMIEKAYMMNIPVETIAMPILGTGREHIDITYIIPSLIKNSELLFKSVETLSDLYYFDKNNNYIGYLGNCLEKYFNTNTKLYDVFISYSSKDKIRVNQIIDLLKENNINYWIAPDSIPAGSEYDKEISYALAKSKILLLCVSRNSMKSDYVLKEFNAFTNQNKNVIPVIIVKSDIISPYDVLLSIYQMIDYTDKNTLIDSIKKKL